MAIIPTLLCFQRWEIGLILVWSLKKERKKSTYLIALTVRRTFQMPNFHIRENWVYLDFFLPWRNARCWCQRNSSNPDWMPMQIKWLEKCRLWLLSVVLGKISSSFDVRLTRSSSQRAVKDLLFSASASSGAILITFCEVKLARSTRVYTTSSYVSEPLEPEMQGGDGQCSLWASSCFCVSALFPEDPADEKTSCLAETWWAFCSSRISSSSLESSMCKNMKKPKSKIQSTTRLPT